LNLRGTVPGNKKGQCVFSAFLLAVFAVFLAEMGDKTQLLAMAFSTRYRWHTVLWAIAVATAVNHLLAVIAGNLVTDLIPIAWVKLLAAASFLLFGLWTLHDDTGPEARRQSSASPFLTVGIAFFLAEMGDKTQLMTMTLAADEAARVGGMGAIDKARQILPVWLGSTTGMILADAVGILAGVVLHKRIPTHVVKWVAAATFAVFGLLGLHESLDLVLPKGMTLHHGLLLGLIPVMIVLMIFIARKSARRAREAATSNPVSESETGGT
jgi:putative Ca2+/H+ antiporter (TMEM165/GDT1 family)